MFTSEIQGDDIRLKRPLVQRDAPLSVEWLRGEEGRKSLLFMGVPEEYIDTDGTTWQNVVIKRGRM